MLKSVESRANYKGYGLERLFKCLLLQFMENLSDRELERYLAENTAAKWFCDFGLNEATPDYSVFSKICSKIGTTRLADATHLIAKASLWQERDEAIKQKYEKLNNETLPKVAKDQDAKIGCKGGDKFWYGYKKHVSVDMQSGLINKVAVTPASITEAQGFKYICPNGEQCMLIRATAQSLLKP